MSLNDAIGILGAQARKVGFEERAFNKLSGAPEFSEAGYFWVSTYALLLAIQADATDSSYLQKLAQSGQQWLDLACIEQEQRVGSVIDGYLVLLLKEAPDEASAAIIHKLELDPTACRKHFAWPSNTDDVDLQWSRIYRITAIGLPLSPENSGMKGSPILEAELQKQLLNDVKRYGAQDAARRHGDPKSGLYT